MIESAGSWMSPRPHLAQVRGQELHRPLRAGDRRAPDPAHPGLDEVDRGEVLPADAVGALTAPVVAQQVLGGRRRHDPPGRQRVGQARCAWRGTPAARRRCRGPRRAASAGRRPAPSRPTPGGRRARGRRAAGRGRRAPAALRPGRRSRRSLLGRTPGRRAPASPCGAARDTGGAVSPVACDLGGGPGVAESSTCLARLATAGSGSSVHPVERPWPAQPAATPSRVATTRPA